MPVRRFNDQLKIRRRRKLLFKIYLGVGFIVLLAVALLYFLFFARVFDLREIKISGLVGVNEKEVGERINSWLNNGFWKIDRRSNYFLVSTDDLRQLLFANFPRLASVEIERVDHDLNFRLAERQPAGIWCLTKTNSCFNFDKSRIAYEKIGPSAGFLLLTVNDRRDRNLEIGDEVASAVWFDGIVLVRESLEKNSLAATYFDIPKNSFGEFEVFTNEGWKIILDVNNDNQKQLAILVRVLKEKISSTKRSKLEYIDLRLPDKVYYK